MSSWTAADIPDQGGRVFVVTGANTGLGLAATRALVEHNAYVVMACRNLEKGNKARESLGELAARAEVRRLDLGDLASVRAFAEGLQGWSIATLINNAGVMAPPQSTTTDGHELQWGTNVLGHFLLTNLLLPGITDRVVWMSSLAHLFGTIDLDDPDFERRPYRAWAAYGQSKLADLMLAYELQRRLSAKGSTVRSLAAHPGYAATELQTRGESGIQAWLLRTLNKVPKAAQSPEMGALPELFAATAPDAVGGTFIGPDGVGGMAGSPIVVGSKRASHDRETARRLWSLCEQQTGSTFEV